METEIAESPTLTGIGIIARAVWLFLNDSDTTVRTYFHEDGWPWPDDINASVGPSGDYMHVGLIAGRISIRACREIAVNPTDYLF